MDIEKSKIDSKMKVLVVDDLADMREVIRDCLHQVGIEKIIEAENGEEALRKAQIGKFDLIISDWNMPVMTGLEFLKALRADEKTKSIPFLIVTGEAFKKNITQEIQAGTINYIVKPFTPESFGEELTKMFV